MAQIPNVHPREQYDSDQAYYDALRLRYMYLVNDYTRKTTYGICSPHYEELLCLYHKLFQYEVILDIVDNDTIAGPDIGGGTTAPGYASLQNNKIRVVNGGVIRESDLDLDPTMFSITDLYAARINRDTVDVARDEIVVFRFILVPSVGSLTKVVKVAFKSGAGAWGTGVDRVEVTKSNIEVIYEAFTSSEDITDIDAITISFGDIGSNSISQEVNSASPIYTLEDNTVYIFTATISGQFRSYLFTGSQPVLLGITEAPVAESNFSLISSSGEGELQNIEIKIGKFWFDVTENIDKTVIEDGNTFRGLASPTRYVVGKVLNASLFDETVLDNTAIVKLFIDNN